MNHHRHGAMRRHVSVIARPLAAVAVTIALAACTTARTETPPPVELPPGDCGAQPLQGLIGQEVTGDIPNSVAVGTTPVVSPGDIRVIRPGMAVTQDYRPERLNLDVDEAGNLTRVWCG